MWLKFPTEQAIMFTDEQLKAGANVLKDMTEEQLAQYDWSQMGDDSLAQLPTELKDKIAKLSKVCLVVSRLNLVRNARVSTKLQHMQIYVTLRCHWCVNIVNSHQNFIIFHYFFYVFDDF